MRVYFILIVCVLLFACRSRTGWDYKPKSNFYPIEKLPSMARKGLKDFTLVPGGTYTSGLVQGKDSFSVPQHQVRYTISPFYLQKTEVTVKEFLEFYRETGEAANCPDTLTFYRNFRYVDYIFSHYFSNSTYADYPIVGVSLEQVNRYILWKEQKINENLKGSGARVLLRLPTSHEMEYASLPHELSTIGESMNGDNIAPWIREGQLNRWNTGEVWSAEGICIKSFISDGYVYPAPALSMKPNVYGLYHICGNVAEWTQSSTMLRQEKLNDISPARGDIFQKHADPAPPLPWVNDTCVATKWDTTCFNRRCAEIFHDSNTYYTKGGSWLHSNYYSQPGAFIPVKRNAQTCWLGFRIAMLIVAAPEN